MDADDGGRVLDLDWYNAHHVEGDFDDEWIQQVYTAESRMYYSRKECDKTPQRGLYRQSGARGVNQNVNRGVLTPMLITDLPDGEPLHEFTRPEAAVVVIGSEGRGISRDVADTLTSRVTIPRLGKAESLNAAVAAGIVCAHLRG